MVYGIIQLINFAHGEVVMIGAMVAFTVINALAPTGLSPLAVVLVGTACAIPVCMLVGYSMERLAYRPLRGAPRLAPLITAIGVSILLQHLAMLVWSRNVLAFPQIINNTSYTLGGASITNVQIAIIAVCVALMGGLALLVYRTPLGAVAGVLYGTYYGVAQYTMGSILGLKAFSAAVLGGIGNIPGAMLGGVLLGLVEALGAGYIGDLSDLCAYGWIADLMGEQCDGGHFILFGSNYQDVFAFLVLILVLVFRPSGLLGERVGDRA